MGFPDSCGPREVESERSIVRSLSESRNQISFDFLECVILSNKFRLENFPKSLDGIASSNASKVAKAE